ncbi:hypothetical protein THRCLA_22117 [Thraustotheca clavata]|uniref:Expansin-like EG45 domain-containing protein n=1 Tax=Thraustotheca clavata TaxID=74557 RepID=A0A1V9ZCI6_9STRA|nr:hypothetical protein THRCLA_22117 [Thraustotheca clavata]
MVRAIVLALSVAQFLAVAIQYAGNASSLLPERNASQGQCSLMKTLPNANQFHVGVSNFHWVNSSNCGRCVQVQCSNCSTSLKITAQVSDKCPHCQLHDLSMSQPMHSALFGTSLNGTMHWNFIDCPVDDAMSICMNHNFTKNSIVVQPVNTVNGVHNMSINNIPAILSTKKYFFKATLPKNTTTQLLTLSMSSIFGETITVNTQLFPGNCTPIHIQFHPQNNLFFQSYNTANTSTTIQPTIDPNTIVFP